MSAVVGAVCFSVGLEICTPLVQRGFSADFGVGMNQHLGNSGWH